MQNRNKVKTQFKQKVLNAFSAAKNFRKKYAVEVQNIHDEKARVDTFIAVDISKKRGFHVQDLIKHPDSWKFHISIDIDELKNEFNNEGKKPCDIILQTIANHFEGDGICFKIINFPEFEINDYPLSILDGNSRLYYGGQFTFYIRSKDYEACEKLRKKITEALEANSVKPGLIPSSDKQLDKYCSLRNDHMEGKYIPAHQLKAGNFNPGNHAIPDELQLAIDEAERNLEVFQKQKQETVLEIENRYYQLYQQARDNKYKSKVKNSHLQINEYLLNAFKYPKQRKKFITIFVKKTLDKDLNYISESLAEGIERGANPEYCVQLKEDILKKRYELKKRKNFRSAIFSVLKFLPVCILALPLLLLPSVISDAIKEKRKQDAKIDVQPFKISSSHLEIKNRFKEHAKSYREELFSPAPSLPINQVASNQYLNKKGNFKLGFISNPVEEERQVYLPQTKIRELNMRVK